MLRNSTAKTLFLVGCTAADGYHYVAGGIIEVQLTKKEQALKTLPLFDQLGEEEICSLSSRVSLKTYPKNTILVSEGDETDSLFIIDTGKVKIYLSDEEGKEVIINILEDGDYFGEVALLDSKPRSASVMTLEEGRLWLISKKDFETWLLQYPQIALLLLRDISKRLRLLTDNVKSLALMDVYGRVARTLLHLAKQKNDKLVIDQKLTQQDIANMVGASREMVSRIMKDLVAGGYVSIERSSIIIHEKLPSHW